MKNTSKVKCIYCSMSISPGKLDYHSNGYCKEYSYKEYLKLKNDYPAQKRFEESSS